jgi:hypothetical protein
MVRIKLWFTLMAAGQTGPGYGLLPRLAGFVVGLVARGLGPGWSARTKFATWKLDQRTVGAPLGGVAGRWLRRRLVVSLLCIGMFCQRGCGQNRQSHRTGEKRDCDPHVRSSFSKRGEFISEELWKIFAAITLAPDFA